MCVPMCHNMPLGEEDDPLESVLSFHLYMDSGIALMSSGHTSKHISLLNHVASLTNLFY